MVTGKETEPESDDEDKQAIKDWKDRDMRALAVICSGLSKDIMAEADIDNGAAAL